MATICPTVTAKNPEQYKTQLKRVLQFAKRVHIDIADGKFAPVNLVMAPHLGLPSKLHVDIHVMYQQPEKVIDDLIRLKPDMVITHAEAEGDFLKIARALHDNNIRVGVALLPKTHPKVIEPAINDIDHVLIFSGDLGHFGGTANMGLLKKADLLLAMKPELEIGWDGGINSTNIQRLVAGGVDILNVGGYIQHAENPEEHFDSLEKLL
jgi:ribulose-phosphate 3-epimerase